MNLRPFFPFYGGKWRVAGHYPKPQHNLIIEPFAGSAGYSLHYPDRDIILLEKDSRVASIWRFLIEASEEELLNLPDVGMDEHVDDLDLPQPAKLLIGWWLNNGSASGPAKRAYSWDKNSKINGGSGWQSNSQLRWGEKVRRRLADQVKYIRHWCVVEEDYRNFPYEGIEATWFVDPPYQLKGRHYKHGSKQIDFHHLSNWCLSLEGQIIVCENDGADWLPFKSFRDIKATNANSKRGSTGISKESMFYLETT